jgi:16S rRNA (cytosine1402-N4)-methyltransferase
MSQAFHHISVMPAEAIAGLALKPGGHYLDATLGGGGHSRLMLEALPDLRVTGLDQDAAALEAAAANLAEFGDRVNFERTNFAAFKPGKVRFDGILADLGVSSAQFDIADRGFSFRQEAPLDMRMDQRQDLTAADIVNHWDEKQLADIFYLFGEERLSRRFARHIMERRPFKTTTELANEIYHCAPKAYRHGRIHPATRIFQGLRIAVNRELEVLETLLTQAPTWLNPGGRIVIITFHSLEDRLVKHRLKENPELQVITKKPIVPQEAETQQNPRARSAKLRIAARKVKDSSEFK